MQDHEMRGLLGPAYDDTSEEQRKVINQACDRIAARWPDKPDWREEHTDAVNGALEVVLGDSTVEDLAGAWRAARDAEQGAHRRLTGGIIAEALAGATETALAERLHLTRMTVRKALGK